MNIIHKATMLKQVRKTGEWKGYILPNNANPRSPWIHPLEITISLASMHDRPSKYIVGSQGERIDLDKYLRNFEYYNCNSELGNRIRFWEEN